MSDRTLVTALTISMLLPALVGCGDGDAQPYELAPLASQSAPELDVAEAQAETPAGTVDAHHASDATYVGAVTEQRYIAITLDEGLDAGAYQRVLVYVCDGHYAEYLAGEVGPDGTTLQGQVLDVELSLGDDAVSGAVVPHGEAPVSFTTGQAGATAGLYVATFDHEDFEYRPVWVVLDDGSQRGGACWRCCSGESCHICCPAAADTAGPTVDWSELQYWWRRWVE